MKIVYELNPPKIVRGERFDLGQLRQDLQSMAGRASQLAPLVDGIHLTDSVLGIPRVSSVTAARYVRDAAGSVVTSCSLRSRDRNFASMCQAVSDAVLAGVDSVLVLMGDEPANSPGDPGLKPSAAVRMLQKEGYDARIKLDLSFPAKIRKKERGDGGDRGSGDSYHGNDKSPTLLPPFIQSKLDARPHSFVTQSIASLSDLGEIVDLARAHGIRVAACIMVPSEKNAQSASIIGLDWKEYRDNPVDFVKQAGRMADRVLLTSPNSFASGLELLRQLRN